MAVAVAVVAAVAVLEAAAFVAAAVDIVEVTADLVVLAAIMAPCTMVVTTDLFPLPPDTHFMAVGDADAIMAAFERWQIDRSYRALLITPERLKYPDIPSDPTLMSEYSSRLDTGESVPEVLVTEDEGDFYLVDGLESALAYSFNMNTFIPATLVKAEHTGEYIQMKNSL